MKQTYLKDTPEPDSSVLPDYSENPATEKRQADDHSLAAVETDAQLLISGPNASIRYQRSKVSLWRDERDGVISPAIRIRGRKFWLRDDLDQQYGITDRGTL